MAAASRKGKKKSARGKSFGEHRHLAVASGHKGGTAVHVNGRRRNKKPTIKRK